MSRMTSDLLMQSQWLMLLIHRLSHVYINIPQTTQDAHTCRCVYGYDTCKMAPCFVWEFQADMRVVRVWGLKLKIQTSASLRLTSIVLSREPTLFLRPRFPVTQLADVSHNCIVCVCVWVSVMAVSVIGNLTFLLVSANVENFLTPKSHPKITILPKINIFFLYLNIYIYVSHLFYFIFAPNVAWY